jgi:hypothetical protein
MEAAMFGIRVFSAPSALAVPHAVGELVVGNARRMFSLDLRAWCVADYQRQWKLGLARLLHGASSTALMTSFRGNEDAPHLMWAIWKEGGFAFVQPHCVLGAGLDRRFDPMAPYEHVGARIPATEEALPIAEWRIELEQLFASVLRIRWPMGQ